MIARAYAKLNLGLEVLGKRPDGYHEIVSVMQLLALGDELDCQLSGDIALTCDPPELSSEDNLVFRAARLLREETHSPLGASIKLVKRIPSPGGLGGGSADAAATLKSLAKLWRVHVPRRRLVELAATLGSDVPFFFFGPTALAKGRGEILRRLQPLKPQVAIVAVPRLDIPDKTRRLYQSLSAADYSDGAQTLALAERLDKGEGLEAGLMVNAFEPVALREFPAIRACRETFLAAGAPWVRLSGAGPALFSLYYDRSQALAVCERLRGLISSDVAVILTETLYST